MASVAEIIFYPAKSGSDPRPSIAEAEAALATRPGFKNAYLGQVTEDRRIHCFVLEWREKADVVAWASDPRAYKIKDSFESVVDLQAGLEPFIVLTTFKHDISAAMAANVTEFGFFSLPDKNATEHVVMQKIIGDVDMSQHPVITVGKAKGAATGHIWMVKPEMAEVDNTTVFTGVFGYDSVDDHWKWRATREHAEVVKGMDVFVKELGLRPVDVLGKRRAMFEGSGIIHVEFKKMFSGPA
ncbi:uncharacterized protein PV09_05466 [Verruconis gallopava]|uniref:ABM domain-containing protein n=1 Tax=Verruconis gallopava TaxID=253628 RepID=A0A0D2A9H0_9PEZI|nr:uncharacterized protein PV09_05466 [Verruconis gallopava]KIW03245.1 hypothetical protein PV09_05466 [Verruconis gallopava]